ncbi:hypothetical protein [Lederbergia lenta]|uniref:hypothetical protein n=1 Tax=Lederbergia lenta TaxID=1467 RepID=UPI003D815982
MVGKLFMRRRRCLGCYARFVTYEELEYVYKEQANSSKEEQYATGFIQRNYCR